MFGAIRSSTVKAGGRALVKLNSAKRVRGAQAGWNCNLSHQRFRPLFLTIQRQSAKNKSLSTLIRSFSTNSPTEGGKQTEEKKTSQNNNEEGHGVPWGFLFTVSFILAVVAYFYRGNVNGKKHDKLKDDIKMSSALSPEEVEEIREKNNLMASHFDALVTRIKMRYPTRKANPEEFFRFCGKALGGEFADEGLKAWYLLERLCMIIEKDNEGQVDTNTLMVALSMTVDSSIDERLGSLFRVFMDDAQNQLISEAKLVEITNALIKTYQVPVRVLTREFNQYPFKHYQLITPEHVVGKAIKEVVAARKKQSTLQGYEEENVNKFSKTSVLDSFDETLYKETGEDKEADAQTAERRKQIKLNTNPVWSLEDFSDIMLSRSLCAWGECNSRSS